MKTFKKILTDILPILIALLLLAVAVGVTFGLVNVLTATLLLAAALWVIAYQVEI